MSMSEVWLFRGKFNEAIREPSSTYSKPQAYLVPRRSQAPRRERFEEPGTPDDEAILG